MDSYQAIYDAVRSRISNGDIGSAVADAARNAFDISHHIACVAQEFSMVAYEQARPFMTLRPKMYPDGGKWCALYGDNLQEGVAAFGDTPAEAAAAFDKAWNTYKLPAHSSGSESGTPGEVCGLLDNSGHPCVDVKGHEGPCSCIPF